MSKTKAAVLGIIGSLMLLSMMSPASGLSGYWDISFEIFSLIALIGSIIILKKQRLGGMITLLGAILTTIPLIKSVIRNANTSFLGASIGSELLIPLAFIFVFIAAFMAIFSKTEELQAEIKPAKEQILEQDIKRVKEIGIISGIVAFIESIPLSFLLLLSYGMSAQVSSLSESINGIISGITPIISSIIIIGISAKIENNTKIKSIILIILSVISLYVNRGFFSRLVFFNIPFIATLIAGIMGLRIKK